MPVVLAVVAVAATVAATATSVAAADSSRKAAHQTADYNAAVANNNAVAAQQASRFEADQIRRKNLLRLGAQRAAGAKSGIDISGGSFSDVVYDSAIQGELDALASEYSGNTQSGYYHSRARLSLFEGQNQADAQAYQTAGSILSGAGSIAGSNSGQYLASKAYPSFGSSGKAYTPIGDQG